MIQQIRGAPQDQQITREKQMAATSSAKETDSFQSLLQAASDSKTTTLCKASEEDSENPSQGEKGKAQVGEKEKAGDEKSTAVLAQTNILLNATVQQQLNANVPVPAVQSQIPAEQPPFTGTKIIQPATLLKTAGQASVKKNVLIQGAESLIQQGTAKGQLNLQQKTETQVASKNAVEAQAVSEKSQPTAASENISQMLPVQKDGFPTGSEVQQAVSRSTHQAAEHDNGLTQVPADTLPAKADTSFGLPAKLKEDKFQIHSLQSGQNGKTNPSQNVTSETGKISNLYSDGKIVLKISDTPAKAKIPVNQQVSSAVAQGIKAGKHQIQVDLYPQSLGKVSVKLMSQNGLLTVEIAASNSKTQSLLASNSDEIKSMLQSSTNQTVQISHPEQEARQYAQRQDQSAYQQGNQQQEQKEKPKPKWYAVRGSDEISTGDFLSLIERTSTAVW